MDETELLYMLTKTRNSTIQECQAVSYLTNMSNAIRIVFASLFTYLLIACNSNAFRKVSRRIEATRDYSSYQLYSPFFDAPRVALQRSGQLKFIKESLDTIYFLEGFATEESMLFGTIWTRRGAVNYTYYNKKLQEGNRFAPNGDLVMLLLSGGSAKEYFSKLPEKATKDRYFFNKAVVKNGRFEILANESFSY